MTMRKENRNKQIEVMELGKIPTLLERKFLHWDVSRTVWTRTISKDSTHAISLFKEFVLYMIEDALTPVT